MHTLKNENGMTVEIIELGATVVSIHVPDKNGKIEDVIIGFGQPDEFKNNSVFFGTIAGPYANRISKGKFTLDGREYNLTINIPPNHLHGGDNGLHTKSWTVEQKTDTHIRFSCSSPDGEDGYPGNVNFVVTYTLTSDNALKIDYEATTDAPTILNLTNHCYFNLSAGRESTILDHEVFIDADMYTPVDAESIPTGEMAPVKDTPMDFRRAKKVCSDMDKDFEQLKFGSGYDHNWVLNNQNGLVRKAATVYDDKSGRVLEVLTDQPGIQFYTGNFLEGTPGKNGAVYSNNAGLCLEAQLFPDSPNKSNFPDPIIRPGGKYAQTTIYKFYTK